MSRFSRKSTDRLATCHQDLKTLFNEVVKHFDCSIACGYRAKSEQDDLFQQGLTKARYPNSKHNIVPSYAVDVAPYPIDWNDLKRFYLFAGYVLATAEQLYQIGAIKHRVRWGGDWDMDQQVKDNNFNDLVHFELIGTKE